MTNRKSNNLLHLNQEDPMIATRRSRRTRGRKRRIRHGFVAAAMGLSALATQASGLSIDIVWKAGDEPAADSNGDKLLYIMRAAANHWQTIIDDPHDLRVVLSYDDGVDDGSRAVHRTKGENGQRETRARIRFNPRIDWYYDPNPADHSEYNMTQTLFRANPTGVAGSAPDVFETGYSGTVKPDAPADASKVDLFSTSLHELGHALGVRSKQRENRQDNDYDVPGKFLNGKTPTLTVLWDTDDNSWDTAHLRAPNALMNSRPPGVRELPSAADVLAAAASSEWEHIDLRRQDFLSDNFLASFANGFNWEGGSPPDANDQVWVRGNRQARIGTPAEVGELNVEENSVLAVHKSIRVTDDAFLKTGAQVDVGSQKTIEIGGELEIDDSHVRVNGGNVVVSGEIRTQGSIDARINGHGVVTSTVGIVNEGSTKARDGTLELDAPYILNKGWMTVDNGTLHLKAPIVELSPFNRDTFVRVGSNGTPATLTVDGSVSDFYGVLTVDKGSEAYFDQGLTLESVFALPFTASRAGTVELYGGTLETGTSFVATETTKVSARPFNGTTESHIKGTATFHGSDITIDTNAELALHGVTTIKKGTTATGNGRLINYGDLLTEADLSVDVENHGVFRIDDPLNDTATVTIDGTFHHTPLATLILGIADQQTNDLLIVTETAELAGGKLHIDLLNNVTFNVGDTFEMMNWGELHHIQNWFGDITHLPMFDGSAQLTFFPHYETHRLLLEVVPLEGAAMAAAVVPEPSAVALLLGGLTILATRWKEPDRKEHYSETVTFHSRYSSARPV